MPLGLSSAKTAAEMLLELLFFWNTCARRLGRQGPFLFFCSGRLNNLEPLQFWVIHRWKISTKNKMKPTNRNADTYVEEQRYTYLSQLPANPLVGQPDLTHWGDTVVGHLCLTLLRKARQDTLAWHSCKTLVLDALVRHSYLTLW